MPNGFRVFGGTAHPDLTQEICRELGVLPGNIKHTRFSDEEAHLQILDNVRGSHIFLVQPTCKPADTNIIELILMCDAFHRASAKSLTVVNSYFGYARQDRKDKPRVPISASVIAKLIQSNHVDRMLTLDLHSPPIQGFFDIPVDHLYALPVFLDYFKDRSNLVVVSPDAGGVSRARTMAERMNVPMAIIDKRRVDANVAEIMNVIGDVKDKDCLMIDDMIDTAGTLVKGANQLMKHGAKSVKACATHGVLSGDAVRKIEESCLLEVVITNSIPYHSKESSKIKCITVAPLLAKAISAIYEKSSVSSLF